MYHPADLCLNHLWVTAWCASWMGCMLIVDHVPSWDASSRFMWTLGIFKSVEPRNFPRLNIFFQNIDPNLKRGNWIASRNAFPLHAVWCTCCVTCPTARLGHQVLQGLVTVGRYDGTDLGGLGGGLPGKSGGQPSKIHLSSIWGIHWSSVTIKHWCTMGIAQSKKRL